MAKELEKFKVQIFSYGYGSHEYYIQADTAPDAVEMAKEQAKLAYQFAQYHELSAIYQNLHVNARGELINA